MKKYICTVCDWVYEYVIGFMIQKQVIQITE